MNIPSLSLLRAALPVALLGAATLAGTAHAEEVTRNTPADAKGQVDISSMSGDVEVIGWERDEVAVEADLDSRADLQLDRDGSRVSVKVRYPSGKYSAGSTDLVIRVPRESSIAVNTVSADQRIKGVRGDQRLKTVSGSIETDFGSGELEAQTASGNVIARGPNNAGTVNITTISGDIQLDGGGSDVDVNTVTGDMNLRVDKLARGRIKTTNGDVDLTTALSKDGRIEAEAVNGDLHFTLRGELNAEFNVETFNGDIDNCFGPKATRTREYGPGNALRFTEGKGDARVRVKTLNGAVYICKR